jgi:hypothetical protein
LSAELLLPQRRHGSTLAARREDIRQAASATVKNRRLTPTSVGTLTGLVANNIDWMKRERPTAPA